MLVLNADSSSIKFAVYGSDGAELTTRYSGEIEQLGNQPHLLAKDVQGQVLEEHRWKSRGDDDPLCMLALRYAARTPDGADTMLQLCTSMLDRHAAYVCLRIGGQVLY